MRSDLNEENNEKNGFMTIIVLVLLIALVGMMIALIVTANARSGYGAWAEDVDALQEAQGGADTETGGKNSTPNSENANAETSQSSKKPTKKTQDDAPDMTRTAVISNGTSETATAKIVANDEIRIRISPRVDIIDDTMQNLRFGNFNKDRYMRCKIMVDKTCVYDTGLVDEGKEIVGDFIDIKPLKSGENRATAEIYSYSLDRVMIGQTNVEILLNLC